MGSDDDRCHEADTNPEPAADLSTSAGSTGSALDATVRIDESGD